MSAYVPRRSIVLIDARTAGGGLIVRFGLWDSFFFGRPLYSLSTYPACTFIVTTTSAVQWELGSPYVNA